jgi:hypothetical protein
MNMYYLLEHPVVHIIWQMGSVSVTYLKRKSRVQYTTDLLFAITTTVRGILLLFEGEQRKSSQLKVQVMGKVYLL